MSAIRTTGGSAIWILSGLLLTVILPGQTSETKDLYKTIYDCKIGMDLAKAESAGYIKATYRARGGSSGASVDVLVERVPQMAGNATLCLTPPRGLRLANSNGSEQAMAVAGFADWTRSALGIVVEKAVAALSGNSISIAMEAYCAEIHKDNPSASASLFPGRSDATLMCLSRSQPYYVAMNTNETVSELTLAKQAAIWQYTDHAAYGDFAGRFRATASAEKLSAAWNRAVLAVRNCQVTPPSTLLRDAAFWNDPSRIEEALLRGAEVNGRGPSGETALHLAADRDNRAALNTLLEAGANINAQTSSGATPLLVSVAKFHVDAAALLLARKADPNIRERSGSSALHYAAGADSNGAAIIRMLLDAGADVNAKDSDGATPLSIATAQNKRDAVELLSAHGANP